jgi:hypothetical protein
VEFVDDCLGLRQDRGDGSEIGAIILYCAVSTLNLDAP